jgi:hypothetical protein
VVENIILAIHGKVLILIGIAVPNAYKIGVRDVRYPAGIFADKAKDFYTITYG